VTTQPALPIATPRPIRNPGADARIEVQISFAESQDSGEAPSVQVRCGACNKRLYDLQVGGRYKPEHARLVEDGTLTVERKCRNCRGLNAGRVTSLGGQPLTRADALHGPWICIHCGSSLGKINPILSRITTTCRCGQESRVNAVDAIMTAYL
jgi:hypothetical protein